MIFYKHSITLQNWKNVKARRTSQDHSVQVSYQWQDQTYVMWVLCNICQIQNMLLSIIQSEPPFQAVPSFKLFHHLCNLMTKINTFNPINAINSTVRLLHWKYMTWNLSWTLLWNNNLIKISTSITSFYIHFQERLLLQRGKLFPYFLFLEKEHLPPSGV